MLFYSVKVFENQDLVAGKPPDLLFFIPNFSRQ